MVLVGFKLPDEVLEQLKKETGIQSNGGAVKAWLMERFEKKHKAEGVSQEIPKDILEIVKRIAEQSENDVRVIVRDGAYLEKTLVETLVKSLILGSPPLIEIMAMVWATAAKEAQMLGIPIEEALWIRIYKGELPVLKAIREARKEYRGLERVMEVEVSE